MCLVVGIAHIAEKFGTIKQKTMERQKYYCLEYLQQDHNDKIFYHLPVTTEVTTDIKVAEQWFQNAVRILKNTYGRELISVTDRELDYMCYIKQAVFKCTEAAYVEGEYILELCCYSHNPCKID